MQNGQGIPVCLVDPNALAGCGKRDSNEFINTDGSDSAVPAENYFIIGAHKYPVEETVRKTVASGNYIGAYNHTFHACFQLQFAPGNFPATSGSYKIVKNPLAADEVAVQIYIGTYINYRSTGVDNRVATVSVQQGKVAFLVDKIEIQEAGMGRKTTGAAVVHE